MSFKAPTLAETGVLSPEALTGMSGLDFFRGIIEGKIKPPPISATIPMQLVEVEKGRTQWLTQANEGLLNPMGTVHGGYALTLMDTAAGCAVHSSLNAGQAYTSVEIKLNFVRPIFPSMGVLRAEGRVLSVGRKIGTAEGKLYDSQNKLLAFATTTCMIWNV